MAAAIDHPRWARAYVAELRRGAALTGGRVLHSVFFGGGTPSLMAPQTVAAVLTEIRRLWPVANDLEVTLEANPTSVEAGRFRAFRDAGINRVSLGVQALRDPDLRRLGRRHSAMEARQALDIARETFDRVSFDLIYAREDQTAAAWRAELDEALALAVDHLSLYQLTIEPGTPFWDRRARGGLAALPDDDTAAELYEITQEVCAAHGLPAYEVSNHARPGAESRHNLIYWRSGDWLGIGPGAHGRLTGPGGRLATETHRAPELWLQAVERTGSGESLAEPLPAEDVATEYLLMSLRLREGTDLARLAHLGFVPAPEVVARLCAAGMLEVAGDRLRTTAAGRPLLDALLRELAPD